MVDVPDAAETTQAPDPSTARDPAGAHDPAGARGPEEHPALTAYRLRTRRASAVYAAVLVVLVVVGFVAVKLAYAHGELNKVSFRTAPSAAAIPGTTPATKLTLAWHNDETPAAGTPYQDGVVVTYQGHTVNGRDALTGQVRWHYTRSDETLCSVLQQDSSTIAIYRRGSNCDEVTGFVTATGKPKYYRTLMDNGTPAVTSLSNVVMTVGSKYVHEFDNAGGVDRWNWKAPAGCTVGRALAGTIGTLISLTCNGKPQLMLRDLYQNVTKFTVDTPVPMVPFTTAAFVGALDPATGKLYKYTADKGAASLVETLTGAPATGYARAAAAVTTSVPTDNNNQEQIEFVQAGKLFTFSSDGSVRWSAASTGSPTLVADAFLAVRTEADQVVLHRVSEGQVQLTSTVSPAPPADARQVVSVGTGLLFAGSGVSVYRS